MYGKAWRSYSLIQARFVFFFSSRRRHTRSLRDWSSDVCSSDLPGQERTDHCLQPLLEREVSDQFTDGKIEDPQPERAEHADGLGTVAGGAPAAENVGQVTADEFPVPNDLFRQVQRGLGAADVIDVIHHVVAAEYDVGIQIPQRDMQDHAPSRAFAKFADVGRDRRGSNGNERGVTQHGPNI